MAREEYCEKCQKQKPQEYLYLKALVFMTLGEKPFENLWEKEKPAFSPFLLMFSKRKFQIFIHIYFVVCKCFKFGQDSNFVVGKRVKP